MIGVPDLAMKRISSKTKSMMHLTRSIRLVDGCFLESVDGKYELYSQSVTLVFHYLVNVDTS